VRAIHFAVFVALVSIGAQAAVDNKSATPASATPDKLLSPDAARDKLINSLLTVSGMKTSLQQLPEQIFAGALQAQRQGHAPAEAQAKISRILETAYPKDAFVQRAMEAMRRNYDEKRYTRLLETLSAPLPRRMAALETQQPSPPALQSYAARLASEPLSKERVRLIIALDQDSGASAVAAKLVVTSVKALASGVFGECPGQKAEMEGALSKQRVAIETATRNTVQVTMAYLYRDVSDEDLATYTKIYAAADSKWLEDIYQKAIEEQLQDGGEKSGKAIAEMVAAKQGKSALTAKCPAVAPTGIKPEAKPDAKRRPVKSTNSDTDARDCLNTEDPAKIAACADKYR
jgi:hypothetical protein